MIRMETDQGLLMFSDNEIVAVVKGGKYVDWQVYYMHAECVELPATILTGRQEPVLVNVQRLRQVVE